MLTNPSGNGVDYVLDTSAESVWVTVNGIAVYIRQELNGVVIEAYKDGHECDREIGKIEAFD